MFIYFLYVLFFVRIRLNKIEFTIENQVLLLEPVSFTLLMKRNLSTAWFTSIPDIDMFGRLNKINLLLSQEDYATIMKVLEENLGESIEESKPTQTSGYSDKKCLSDQNKRKISKCI